MRARPESGLSFFNRRKERHRSCRLRGFSLQFLCLVIGNQRINNRLQSALHDQVQLVQRQPDAVIGKPVLREVIRANFFLAIAGLDLPTPFRHDRRLLLLLLQFVKTRAQNTHCFRAILDLRFFVLL